MKPRILHIIPDSRYASAGKQLCLLAQGLPRDQFDLHICILDGITGRHGHAPVGMSSAIGLSPVLCSTGSLPGDAGVPPGPSSAAVPVTVISMRWKYDPRSCWELKLLIDRFQPNLIHAWTSDANVYGLAAAKLAGVKRLVAGYGCVDPFKSGPRLAIDRCIGKHCVRLTANGAGVRDFYIRKGLPAEKFHIIPGGVKPSPPTTTTRRQLLAELTHPRKQPFDRPGLRSIDAQSDKRCHLGRRLVEGRAQGRSPAHYRRWPTPRTTPSVPRSGPHRRLCAFPRPARRFAQAYAALRHALVDQSP